MRPGQCELKIWVLVPCSASLDEKCTLQGCLGCREQGTKGHTLWTCAALWAALFKTWTSELDPGSSLVRHPLVSPESSYSAKQGSAGTVLGIFWILFGLSEADRILRRSNVPCCGFAHLSLWLTGKGQGQGVN